MKGEQGDVCNRGACDSIPANYQHRDNKKFYCSTCAQQIMSYPENVGILTYTGPSRRERPNVIRARDPDRRVAETS